jgi:hypothetical protein
MRHVFFNWNTMGSWRWTRLAPTDGPWQRWRCLAEGWSRRPNVPSIRNPDVLRCRWPLRWWQQTIRWCRSPQSWTVIGEPIPVDIMVVYICHSLLTSSACCGGIAGSMEGLELGTLAPVTSLQNRCCGFGNHPRQSVGPCPATATSQLPPLSDIAAGCPQLTVNIH